MDTHGFIHCSTANQLIPVANRFFRGRREVRALDIDETRVRSEIIHENLEGGTESFRHIYGPLHTEAVTGTFMLKPTPDGTFTAPAELRAYRGEFTARP